LSVDATPDRIRSFIASEIMLEPEADVTGETVLLGGVMDSLGYMQLVSYLQEQFGIVVEEQEVTPDNFRTVADVERLVDSKLRTPGSPD
jgi:D-alanine--poly(phosphoribitol) ligase subunit 2